jgi:hypothetical protein
MKVSVDAFDNLSLKHIAISLDGVVVLDTTFTSATPTLTHTFDVPLAGIQRGSQLVVRSFAFDGAGNRSESAAVSVTAFDFSALVVVSAPTNAGVFRAGRATAITVSATESSGSFRIG